MDSPTLVSDNLSEVGRQAVDAIEGAGIQLPAAFWAYFSDSQEWRLVLATPALERHGPNHVYADIQVALRKERIKIPLRFITIVSPRDPLATLPPGLGSQFQSCDAFSSSSSQAVVVHAHHVYRPRSQGATVTKK